VAAFLFEAATADDVGKADKPAADPMVGKEAGQVRDDNGLKMKLVWCPPGFFTMEYLETTTGASDSKTRGGLTPAKVTPAKVFLTNGYWLGKYEVTQREWKRVTATEPWKGQIDAKEGDAFPAVCAGWDDAMEFCRKLTDQERKAGRLPDN